MESWSSKLPMDAATGVKRVFFAREKHKDPLNLVCVCGQLQLIYFYEQNSGGFLGWHSWI